MVLRRAARRDRPFDLTPKAIREVEFRERVRGYDPAQVDPLLDEVADQVAAMQAELAELAGDREQPAVIDVGPESMSPPDAVALIVALLHVRYAYAEAVRILADAKRRAREIEHDARVERRRVRRGSDAV